MLALGYAFAALIGLSLGMLGGGGSILTVPIFVYVLGFDPKLAIAMSLPVVGMTSAVGVMSHWRHGNVDLKIAAMFGLVAMAGAFTGARVAAHVSGEMQLAGLAIIMLLAAISMFRSADSSFPTGASDQHAPVRASLVFMAAVALGVGILTGLLGVGGGFLVVPALVLLARVPMKQAVGTSLFVIAMNCASGFAGYMGRVHVPWAFIAGFTTVAAGGIIAGSWMSRFVSQRSLKRAFSVFLVLMGAFVLYKNRSAFFDPRPASGEPR